MTEDDLLRLMSAGESQTLEFKESLGAGRQREGVQTLVAFANRDGGRVLFGVKDDGSLKGVDVGEDTLENLANLVMQHTYPSLPVHIEEVNLAGRTVVVVEAPADRPPIVGLYVYSASAISPTEPVDATGLAAFRRVGRTNQSSDLMWLRPEMPSDPKLRLTVLPRWIDLEDGIGEELAVRAWVEYGSASAHGITFITDPPLFVCDEGLDDLPRPYSSGGGLYFRGRDSAPPPATIYGWETFQDFNFTAATSADRGDYWVVATYTDDFGLSWECRRLVRHEISQVQKGDIVRRKPGRFSRRITSLPSKKAVEP